MARVQRTGFEYTRLDLNFWSDIKIRRAIKYNTLAPTVYIALLSFILKDNYYLVWNDDIPFLIADQTGLNEDEVKNCIEILASVNLIDRDLMHKDGIITSRGIQKQYNALCESTKRKGIVTASSQYSLLSDRINSEKTPISSEETPINSDKLGGNDEKGPKNGINSEDCKERKEAKERKQTKEREGSKGNYYSSCCSSLSSEQTEEEEKQQQSFVLNFFVRNWREPMREYFSEFLPWNNTGGRSWRDMSDEAREAAVMLWKQTPQQAPRFEQRFLDMWHQVIDMLMQDKAPHEVIWAALDDGLHWGKGNDGKYELSCHKCLYEYLERNERNFAKFIPIIHRHYGKSARLRYLVDDETPPINDTT